ncbi:MAG: hypothetical protein FJY80_07595 [Candidatus Aminicenantes bacterium]|nr:hypothetical protein [Candidatus Aminicenantes bacterium]
MFSTRPRALPGLAAACVLLLAAGGPPQFQPAEAAEAAAWEEFLKSAKITAEEQMGGPDATTRPWKVSLEKGGRSRFGLWKNVDVAREDLVDTWRFEVAAYRLDRLLGLDLVPPTVERRVKGEKGSLQLWVDGTLSLKKKTGDGTAVPADKAPAWNRLAFLQRAFDSLIGNEDRNANNILVTEDWRMLLIDHSRSFRTKKTFISQLIFGERGLFRAPDGSPYPIVPLPRVFYEKLKALDETRVREAVRPYLTKSEVVAVVLRAGVLVKEIEDVARLRGEAAALY